VIQYSRQATESARIGALPHGAPIRGGLAGRIGRAVVSASDFAYCHGLKVAIEHAKRRSAPF